MTPLALLKELHAKTTQGEWFYQEQCHGYTHIVRAALEDGWIRFMWSATWRYAQKEGQSYGIEFESLTAGKP